MSMLTFLTRKRNRTEQENEEEGEGEGEDDDGDDGDDGDDDTVQSAGGGDGGGFQEVYEKLQAIQADKGSGPSIYMCPVSKAGINIKPSSVGARYIIDKKDYSKTELDMIRKSLTIEVDNPFAKRRKFGDRGGAVIVYKHYVEPKDKDNKGKMILPRFWAESNLGLARNAPSLWSATVDSDGVERRGPHSHVGMSRFVRLPEEREYQREMLDKALEAIHPTHGGGMVMLAQTGTGKTYWFAQLLHRLGMRAVFVSPNIALGEQVVKELRIYLPDLNIQLFCGGKKLSIWDTSDIVVVVDRSLNTGRGLPHATICKRYPLIAIDECHHAPASGTVAYLSMVAHEVVVGLTASPERSDKQNNAIYWYLGPIVHVYYPELPPVDTKAWILETGCHIPVTTDENGVLCDHLYTRAEMGNAERNRMIINILLRCRRDGVVPMMFGKHPKHFEVLRDMLLREDPAANVAIFDQNTRPAYREHVRQNGCDVLMATSCFGEGLHLPFITCSFFVTKVKGVRAKQGFGRASRKAVGKEKAWIITLQDSSSPSIGMAKYHRDLFSKSNIPVRRGSAVDLPEDLFD